MKPRITLSVDKILEMSSVSKFKKNLILRSVKWLENYFGSEVFLEVPKELMGINPEIFPFLKIVKQMRKDGIAKGDLETGWLDKNIFTSLPDEIFYPIYRIRFAPKTKVIGSDFFDEKKALLRCLGELSERYNWIFSSFFYEGKTIKASYAQLIKKGKKVMDIFNIAGFTEDQRREHKCLQFDKDTVFEWIEANSLLEEGKIYCPIQLFSSAYYSKNVKNVFLGDVIGYLNKKEPMLRWGDSTGSAAGKTVASALLTGILEIIEREAIIINHLNKLSPPSV